MNKKIGAIVLAAGKGKRMKAKDKNKVVFLLADKPMILHTIHILQKLNLNAIVVVVGFAKHSVMKVLEGTGVLYAEQRKRLGTGHAALVGLKKLPEEITDVLVFYGDDSAFYNPAILQNLIDTHVKHDSDVTFLTISVDNPTGLGRVLRNSEGKVTAIIEEKDANDLQRKITEINPACYIFSTQFLRKYLPTVEKSPVTGEYYLTSLIDIALKHNKKIETLHGGKLLWRGVNTPDELKQAEELFLANS